MPTTTISLTWPVMDMVRDYAREKNGITMSKAVQSLLILGLEEHRRRQNIEK